MVAKEPLACRADHHRHPLSYVERTEAVRERMECLFCADPVPPGTAEDTEPRLASKVTCRDVDWQGTAALMSGAFVLACRPHRATVPAAAVRSSSGPSGLWTSCLQGTPSVGVGGVRSGPRPGRRASLA